MLIGQNSLQAVLRAGAQVLAVLLVDHFLSLKPPFDDTVLIFHGGKHAWTGC